MRWPQGRGRTQASAPGQRCKNSQANWVCLQVVGLTHWRTNNSQGAKSCKTNQCDRSSSLCYQHRQTQNQNFSHPASGRTTNLPCIVTFYCCFAYAHANVYVYECIQWHVQYVCLYVLITCTYNERGCLIAFCTLYSGMLLHKYVHTWSLQFNPKRQPWTAAQSTRGHLTKQNMLYIYIHILYNSSRSKVHTVDS